jgi:glycosyltransferase involved in cell wall biosynthesis
MKILMLADVFYPDTIGGAGRIVYHLGLEFSQKGHEVHIITRNTDGKFPYYEELHSNLYVHRFFTPHKESLALLLLEIKNSYFMAKQLSMKIEFDIVCIHQSLVAIGPLFLDRLKNIPLVYYFHSPWHEEFLIKKRVKKGIMREWTKAIAYLMRWIEKRMFLRSDRIIVLSQYIFHKVLEIHHFTKRKIIRIPGGVDLHHFHLPVGGKAAAKSIAGLPLGKTVFFTVRNLVPRMGLESLIGAFNGSETLRQKGLLLIGGTGFLEDRLKTMVDDLNLKNSIRFLGHIPDNDLPGIYQAADFFVLPTEKLEGFGLVILEAMACGTPVLGTPVGAIPEVIGSFDKRLIFDGMRWSDMRRKMEEVIEKPHGYHFAPEGCRKFVEKNFSWKKVASSFEKQVLGLI